MHMGNSHSYENSQDSEETLVYITILDKGEKRRTEY